MTRFYSSDLHFGHRNIITYSNRPFKNEWEMNEKLVEYHNQIVSPSDYWTCLGDISMDRGGRTQREAFIKLVRSMHGHKRLHLGNHDHFPIQVYIDAGFEKIYATWRDDSGLLFSHFPLHPNSLGSARANIHGHIHGNPDYTPSVGIDKHGKVKIVPFINISVEVTNYRPLSIDEIEARVAKAIENGE